MPPVDPGFGWRWDNSYARLPEGFHSRVDPTAVSTPGWGLFNRPLAESLGIQAESLDRHDHAHYFTGNRLFEGSEPIAQAYAGHQFGNLARLGDGRAILLGEHLDPSGRRWDVQLKGPGLTPYSRGGDGRAALGPMLREYLISEAMHALRIPTTRSLAVALTGEPVFRETTLPGAVLTRIAASHIRVGTFELFSALGDVQALKTLAAYTLLRHFPERSNHPKPGKALLEAVIERQSALVAQWMRVGFVHGVLNTDNVAVSGETIDYGPCAFMDAYDPATVFSSIDRQGRYAFGNQPKITSWNLARFAEALLPILDDHEATAIALAQECLESFPAQFQRNWLAAYRGKLGLVTEEDGDATLIEELLAWMHSTQADFTQTFRGLRPSAPGPSGSTASDLNADQQNVAHSESTPSDPKYLDWHQRWTERLARQGLPLARVLECMHQHNPVIIPRNHAVQAALDAASQSNDWSGFHALLAALQSPYQKAGAPDSLRNPPPLGTPRCRTFCGT
jgi:uncharacterized protein YdiU (UPF0061 family)